MRLVVAVVVVLAGCGDGVGAPDATPPSDAEMGLVRVRYRGGVLEDHPVFFQNVDGSLVLATRTGVDGTANTYMAPGGYVTLIDVKPSSHFLYTWAQVQPGDEVVVDDLEMGGIIPTTTIVLSIPAEPSSGFYDLRTSCGSENVSAAAGASLVVELGDCRGRTDMFVLAFGAGFHYLYAEDVPVKNGSSVSLPPPYSVMERSTVEVHNAPTSATSMDIRQQLIGEGHSLTNPTVSGLGFASLPVVAGTGTANFDMPLPPPATALTELAPFDGIGISRQHVARWERTKATTVVDFGAITLRRYLTRPRYEVPSHSITWTEEPTGTVADAVIASWSWYRPEIGGTYQWRIIAPRGAAPTVSFPVLPDSQYLPREHDTVNPPFVLVNIAIDGGYERLRTKLPSLWPVPNNTAWPAEAADGPAGEVVYQELAPEQFPPD